MNICVFDTETTSLEKPFCYNVGFTIIDTIGFRTLEKHDYVVEQIWHNDELFSTAYYAEKRQIYVQRMRAHETIMDKWGYIMQTMCRLFKKYEVVCAYAFNSGFDDKVFAYNCDWFKTMNPFDNVPIYDIRGLAHAVICDDQQYKNFCEKHEYFSESGNYSTTAETVYRFIKQDLDFNEEHTALADAEIESEILLMCVMCGCEYNKEYKAKRSIERLQIKTLHIKDVNQIDYYFDYVRMRMNKERTEIKLYE